MAQRTLMLMVSAALLTSCGSRYPEIRDYCERLQRPVTDDERKIAALAFFYEADELLLLDFPPGTPPSNYVQNHNPFDGPQPELIPPYVPSHFRQFKRAFQSEQQQATGMDIATAYLRRFPTCCEVVEPGYVRAGYDGDQMNVNGLAGPDLRWNRDIIIRQDPHDRNLIEDTDGYRKYDPDRFIEIASDVCATALNASATRGG